MSDIHATDGRAKKILAPIRFKKNYVLKCFDNRNEIKIRGFNCIFNRGGFVTSALVN